MNVFNRIVTVLLLIFLWALIVFTAAVPEMILSWVQVGLDAIGQGVSTLAVTGPNWLYPALRAGLVALVTIIALALLWLELRPTRVPTVKVLTEAGGEASVTADSVSRRLIWHIDQLADVIHVEPTVRARGGGVEVQLHLETAPEIEVPMKTEEVMAVTREVIEDRMGLQLRKLKVDIRHAPYPETV